MKVAGRISILLSPPAGIAFHNRPFTEPTPFSLALPPASSGIYAILAPDALCTPRPFRVIYFGESDNFSRRVTESHERYNDWVREAGGLPNTYVAFSFTPLLREEQRRWVENDLIARYRPVCNMKGCEAPLPYQPLLRIAK